MVAAIDRRVKAVVCQVPLISGHDNLRALVRADFIAGLREQFDADRLARFRGDPGHGPGGQLRLAGPVGAADAGLVGMVQRDRQDPRTGLAQRGDAAERGDVHRVRARQLPALYLAPPPSCCWWQRATTWCPPPAIAAFDTAHQPKELVILPGGHFEAYTKGFEAASGQAPRTRSPASGGVTPRARSRPLATAAHTSTPPEKPARSRHTHPRGN